MKTVVLEERSAAVPRVEILYVYEYVYVYIGNVHASQQGLLNVPLLKFTMTL